jgi:DNA-binding NarL/FixJ family response regulator
MVILVIDRSGLLADRLMELVAEDNPGVTYHAAKSAGQAIELLRETIPGVVIIDLGMTSRKDIILLKKVREKNSRALIIVLYGINDDILLNQCKEFGADLVYDKYTEFEKIPAAISDYQSGYFPRTTGS